MNILEDKQILKVTENIYQVLAPQNGQFPYCHGFLFTGNENIMLDAGIDSGLMQNIDREIGIDKLVISHSHPDHISRWKVLNHRELIIPAETPDSAFNIEDLGERYVGSRERGLHWVEVIGKRLGIDALRKPDGRYRDGDIFDTGTLRIEAVHAPGHLDDHYCFFEHRTGTLFSTDIYFTKFGPWYGNPEGRVKSYKESVLKIMSLPYKRVCTSHKLPHEGDAAAEFNAYLESFDRQKETIFRMIGAGKTLHELTMLSPFYNNKFMDMQVQYAFEEHMILENLSILIEEGRLVLNNGIYTPVSG